MSGESAAERFRRAWAQRVADGRADVLLVVTTVFGEVLFTVPGVVLVALVAALVRYGWEDHRAVTLSTLVLLLAVVVEGFRELARALRGLPVRWRSLNGVCAVFAVVFVLWLVGVVGEGSR